MSKYYLLLIIILLSGSPDVDATPLLEQRLGDPDCPETKTHRVVCQKRRDILMTCGRWAALVQNAQNLGPQRSLIVFKNLISERNQQEQTYLLFFAQDASQFVMKHNFKNGDQAYAQAMHACGAWSQG